MCVCYWHGLRKLFYRASDLEEASLPWDPETSRGMNVLTSDDFVQIVGYVFMRIFWGIGEELLDVKDVINH